MKQDIFPYIKRILQGANVPWKPLGEVTEVKTGQSVNKNIIADNTGEYPVINSGREPLGFINVWNTDNDPIGITSRGAGVGSVTWQEGKYFRGNLNYSASIKDVSTLNTRFLYHLLLQMQPEIHALCTFEGIPALNAVNLKKLQIPLPPLSVQLEIVRILDKFTQLEAELEAELDCRKRQYEYYRDMLLTYDENQVEWKTLGEIFNLKNGYTPSKANKEYWENGAIPWFRMEDIRENGGILNTSLQKVAEVAVKGGKLFPANSIIVATSATIGEHALITVPFLANQRFTVLSLKPEYADKFNIYFLYYYCFILDNWCQKNTSISSFPSVDMNGFRRFQIPIPPIEEQERIAGILDKFDTLVNSISEGLPREIELRRKQYEYYREKLLSFPKN